MKSVGCLETSRSAEHGYTLVETLAVLIIIAMVTGLSAYALAKRQQDPSAEAFAEELLTILVTAGQKAIISGSTTSVVIDLQKQVLTNDQSNRQLAVPDKFNLSVLAGQELIKVENRVPVYFFGQGGSTGIQIDITDAMGRNATVSTNWLTGISTMETISNE